MSKSKENDNGRYFEYLVSKELEEKFKLVLTERAKAGLFMSFQSPPSISGLTNYKIVQHRTSDVKKYKQITVKFLGMILSITAIIMIMKIL